MNSTLQNILFKDLVDKPAFSIPENRPLFLWSNMEHRFSSNDWNTYFKLLPEKFQAEICKYIKWEDRQNCLIGKLLIYSGYLLKTSTPLNYDQLQRELYGKPFIADTPIQFNISHSDHCVAGIFDTFLVGIDVEKVRDLPLQDFLNIFTPEEQQDIDRYGKTAFFRYWTRKEAISKAVGKGMGISYNTIDAKIDRLQFEDHQWHTTSFEKEGYVCSYSLETTAEPYFLELLFN